MKVHELIAQLQKVNPDAQVFTGYDGNIVGSKAAEVEEITSEAAIGNCWHSVHVGDVVILEG
jgi:hypothetical protein